ncbi:MAG: GNAT family N-acetyltransferase [Bacillota bacterium]|nr:GNAT family N-acetyltransferase [Bacillota bacterium]
MYTITWFWNQEVEDSRFRYAVIPARFKNQWVFVRQKAKATFELPGGRREPGESMLETARRELYEETGATQFSLKPIVAFMVTPSEEPAAADAPCGMLYLADILAKDPVPESSEIGENIFSDMMPAKLTYPEIQPRLFRLAASFSEYRIRKAIKGDAAAVCRLNRVSLGYDYPESETAHRLEQILLSSANLILVAEHLATGRVAGYIHLCDYECTYSDSLKNILAIAVDPADQGRELGRRLLAAGEKWARDTGASGIRLVSGANRKDAHQFYLSCGYCLRKEQKNFVKLF